MAMVEGDGKARWYHNLWFVLVMLFVVLGPFGLPLVWKNPTLSRGMKVALTVLTLVYTGVLAVATFRAARDLLGDAGSLGLELGR
jgi:hypothetical protein